MVLSVENFLYIVLLDYDAFTAMSLVQLLTYPRFTCEVLVHLSGLYSSFRHCETIFERCSLFIDNASIICVLQRCRSNRVTNRGTNRCDI